jgi:superfamily II DNA/RNA helicase
LTDLDVCMHPGLKHERAIVKADNSALLILTRLLRKELRAYDDSVAAGVPAQRARVVVFFPDEDTARAAIEPLRDALWGDHWLCVLLPKTGVRPLTIMEQFKKNETSVMLATANSVRGLDFPALTHVYTMYLPVDDPREYVHLAGRVGRVGQQGTVAGDGGHVVSILSEEDAPKMDELARLLGFQFTDIEAPEENLPRTEDGSIDVDKMDVDKLRRYLEDAMTFSIPGVEAEINLTNRDAPIDDLIDDEDDDDEEEVDDDDHEDVEIKA